MAWLAPKFAYAQEVGTTTTSSSTTSTVSINAGTSTDASTTPSTDSDAILEVSYTLDGSSWHVLRTVSASQFTNQQSFTIPVYAINGWSDIAHLQIRVRTLSSLSQDETVFLDGMTLSVAYQDNATLASSTAQASSTITSASSTTPVQTQPNTAGVVDKPQAAQGDIVNVSGAHPDAFFEIYWLDDPSSAPEAGHEYGATIGDDGTLQIDTNTLPLGQLVLAETTDKAHCGNLTLEDCRTSAGYVGEIPLTVSSSTVQ